MERIELEEYTSESGTYIYVVKNARNVGFFAFIFVFKDLVAFITAPESDCGVFSACPLRVSSARHHYSYQRRSSLPHSYNCVLSKHQNHYKTGEYPISIFQIESFES
ncbi:hypothetical protein T4B_14734 [Trichinella pseudospiralis]|uniref:Uncharacterized protein n=1 Tax=Trichinella pseudospiralis TaxID=6337 RepID=A0A0V1JRQ9_TRIPS|nr:hypothetical protein T4A_5673 [Trichinella pseudospiralis]KRZ33766.1 hypothetical protein T4B_14734 [Trichinella pseudospiralis]KRZ37620.1 hypothetical protein T4C_4750 [Trichinella pseudospiralis]